MNAREPTCVWCLGGIGQEYSVCPRLVCPISKIADAIVFGEGKLCIARKKVKLADLSKLHAHRRWCASSNPIARGAPPMQRESPMLYRIVEATEIEIVVKVEFMWRLRQINAVLDFKVALHSGLT